MDEVKKVRAQKIPSGRDSEGAVRAWGLRREHVREKRCVCRARRWPERPGRRTTEDTDPH